MSDNKDKERLIASKQGEVDQAKQRIANKEQELEQAKQKGQDDKDFDLEVKNKERELNDAKAAAQTKESDLEQSKNIDHLDEHTKQETAQLGQSFSNYNNVESSEITQPHESLEKNLQNESDWRTNQMDNSDKQQLSQSFDQLSDKDKEQLEKMAQYSEEVKEQNQLEDQKSLDEKTQNVINPDNAKESPTTGDEAYYENYLNKDLDNQAQAIQYQNKTQVNDTTHKFGNPTTKEYAFEKNPEPSQPESLKSEPKLDTTHKFGNPTTKESAPEKDHEPEK